MALLSSRRVNNLIESTLLPAIRQLVSEISKTPVGRRGQQIAGRVAQRFPGILHLIGIAGVQSPAPAARPAAPAPPRQPRPQTSSTEALVQELTQERDWRRRAEAARGLWREADSKAVSALVGALRDPAVEVAVAAVDSLRRVGSREAKAGLETLLDSADGYTSPLTRVAALRAIAQEQPQRVVAAVGDTDVEVSLAAIELITSPNSPVTSNAGRARLAEVSGDESGFYAGVVQQAAHLGLSALNGK